METFHAQEQRVASPGGRMPALYGRQDGFRYVVVRGEGECESQLNSFGSMIDHENAR